MDHTTGIRGQAAAFAAARAALMTDAALRYVEERHWDVVPGTWLTDGDADGRGRRCSCGEELACVLPGAHPAGRRWADEATGNPAAVRRLWAAVPSASVLLPAGRGFDGIEVPEPAGCLALARLDRRGLPLGPVLSLPTRRMVFLVLPGAAAKVPALLSRLGWPPAALDLVVRGEGDWVPAPPTRIGDAGRVRWTREPTSANRWLPDAGDVVAALAYACGLAAAGQRTG